MKLFYMLIPAIVAAIFTTSSALATDDTMETFGLSLEGVITFDGGVSTDITGGHGYNRTSAVGDSYMDLSEGTHGNLCSGCINGSGSADLGADLNTRFVGGAWGNQADTPLVIENANSGMTAGKLTVGNGTLNTESMFGSGGIAAAQGSGTDVVTHATQNGGGGASTLINYTGSGCSFGCGDGTVNNFAYAWQNMHVTANSRGPDTTAAVAGTSGAAVQLLQQITRP